MYSYTNYLSSALLCQLMTCHHKPPIKLVIKNSHRLDEKHKQLGSHIDEAARADCVAPAYTSALTEFSIYVQN